MTPNFCLQQSYSQRIAPDGKIIHFPGLRITFKHGKYSETVGHALLDTGADETLLPLSMAIAMGFQFDLEGDKTLWFGAGGKQFVVYKSPVPLEIILQSKGFRDFSWETYVHFTVEQPTILIGRRGFLDNFIVTFDGKSRMTELRVS